MIKEPFAIGGSGSSYIYGFCDANYRDNFTQEECIEFVKTGRNLKQTNSLINKVTILIFNFYFPLKALALAMSRDGSSGGVIRIASITEAGVVQTMTSGNEIPRFFGQ
jgi:20S proteasome subunit beta 1